VWCSVVLDGAPLHYHVAVCCGVVRCVAVCCGVVQCGAVCCKVVLRAFTWSRS